MSSSKPWQCLSCRLSLAVKPVRPRRRKFHTSPASAQKKPAYPNVKAVDMGLVIQQVEQAAAKIRPYTSREKQLLALKYTPEQLAAIEAGEKAIDSKDLVTQARLRRDAGGLRYLDDMSKIRPVVDKPIRAPDEDIDPDIRPKTEQELAAAFARMHQTFTEKMRHSDALDEEGGAQRGMSKPGLPENFMDLSPDAKRAALNKMAEEQEGPDPVAAWERLVFDPATFQHSPKGTIHSQQDVLAPELPKIKSPGLRYTDEEEDPHMVRLCQQTGLSKEDIRKIRIKNLVQHRVVNQTRMGKIQSLYYLTIAGNQNGLLGIGEGKAAEDEDGRRQAMMSAIRNMKPIPRYEERTIYGEVEGKVGASVVKLSARGPGKHCFAR